MELRRFLQGDCWNSEDFYEESVGIREIFTRRLLELGRFYEVTGIRKILLGDCWNYCKKIFTRRLVELGRFYVETVGITVRRFLRGGWWS